MYLDQGLDLDQLTGECSMPVTDHGTRVCEKGETQSYTPRTHILFFLSAHPVHTLLHGVVPPLFYGGCTNFLVVNIFSNPFI
jgi:hypothetical protein